MIQEVEKEYNKITRELLERTERYKNSVIEDMIVYKKQIIKGIVTFQEVIKEINPLEIDDIMIEIIKNTVESIITIRENEVQVINAYVRYGINHCFMILDNYGMIEKRRILGK